MNIYPYVYRGTHPTTGEFYIGMRYANKVPASADLGFHYKTSSKYVTPRFDEFEWCVIAEFFTKEAAYDFEQELIHEDINQPGILNRICHFGKMRLITTKHTAETRAKMLGHQVSADTRSKISKAMIGRKHPPRTQQHLENISKGQIGKKWGIPLSLEHRAKIAAANKGKTKTPESIAKKSATMLAKRLAKLCIEESRSTRA